MVQSKKDCCNTTIPPGQISDKILNPLTSIKGYIQLKLKNREYYFDEEALELLLSEIAQIEDVVEFLERLLSNKSGKHW